MLTTEVQELMRRYEISQFVIKQRADRIQESQTDGQLILAAGDGTEDISDNLCGIGHDPRKTNMLVQRWEFSSELTRVDHCFSPSHTWKGSTKLMLILRELTFSNPVVNPLCPFIYTPYTVHSRSQLYSRTDRR